MSLPNKTTNVLFCIQKAYISSPADTAVMKGGKTILPSSCFKKYICFPVFKRKLPSK